MNDYTDITQKYTNRMYSVIRNDGSIDLYQLETIPDENLVVIYKQNITSIKDGVVGGVLTTLYQDELTEKNYERALNLLFKQRLYANDSEEEDV